MAVQEAPISLDKEIVTRAASNYIECLALNPNSKVLIVTDGASEAFDANVNVRREMSLMINNDLEKADHQVSIVEFNHATSKDFMHDQTTKAIWEQDQKSNGQVDDPLMIVYLGDSWDNRPGMYQAANDQTQNRQVRVAGSLGFSTGDCRVMSQMSNERREKAVEVNQYFKRFFSEHPRGSFLVETREDNETTYQLTVDYNTDVVPFHTDLGFFQDEYQGELGNFEYLNIPGGERYAPPYPFRNSNGQFIAEGIVFTVEHGMVVNAEAPEEVLKLVTETSQKTLLSLIADGEQVPLSELGLGFYTIAGIETYEDSSVLSREKRGPHGGMGVDPSEGSPESGEMRDLAEKAGGFHHTDFVMDKPTITHLGEKDKQTHFYPPQE